MVALSASRLVCSAIVAIRLTTSPIRTAAFDSSLMRASVVCACATASPAILLDSSTCRLISAIDALISSVAAAAERTLLEESSETEPTTPDSRSVISAVFVSVVAETSSSVADDDMVWTMRPTVDFELVGKLAHFRLAFGDHALFGLGPLAAQPVRLDHVLLEEPHRVGHFGDFIRASGCDIGVDVARGDRLHSGLQSGQAADHAASDIEPADQEGDAEAEQRDRDQEHPALRDRGFGTVHGGRGGSLAAAFEIGKLRVEILGQRAVLGDDFRGGAGGFQLLPAKVEDVAVALAEGDERVEQLGDVCVFQNLDRLVDPTGGGAEAVPHRRHQIQRRQVGRLDQNAEHQIGLGAQLEHRLQLRKLLVRQRRQGFCG